jgi:hypothetical protein
VRAALQGRCSSDPGPDGSRRQEPRHRRLFAINIVVAVATLAFFAAGVVLATAGADGTYAAVPAAILSYLVAISEAWILLVAIHR